MNWFLVAMQKYAVLSGRAHRREYWLFVLVSCLIGVTFLIIDIATGTYSRDSGLGLLSGIFVLATLLPSIGAGVRRLHDTGQSGWWYAIVLIPFIGGIVLLIMCAMPGQSGENRFGPDPMATT